MPNDLKYLIIIISYSRKDHYLCLGCIVYASYVYKKLGYLDNKIKVYIPSGDLITTCDYVNKNISGFLCLMSFGEENYCDFI